MESYVYTIYQPNGWRVEYVLTGKNRDAIWRKKMELEKNKVFRKYLNKAVRFEIKKIPSEAELHELIIYNLDAVLEECYQLNLTESQLKIALLSWVEFSRKEIADFIKRDCFRDVKYPMSGVNNQVNRMCTRNGFADLKDLIKSITRFCHNY